MRSAQALMGALEPWASSTRRTILREGRVLAHLGRAQDEGARGVEGGADTASSSRFSTGRLSPVSMLSSSADWPSSITPSDGNLLARSNADEVADDHRLDGQVALGAVANDAGGARL